MVKNVVSGVILLLAAAVFIVNVWNPGSGDDLEGETVNGVQQEDTENIPGANLAAVKEGSPAPDFKLPTIEGEAMRLSDYRGKKVILNFWATWCPPCKAEMPHMQNFYEKNKDKGVEIVAVNLTNLDKGEERIKQFIEDYGLTFTVPLDVEGNIGIEFQAFTIPTSYIIDTNGVIQKKIIGPMDEEMMNNLIKNVD
ncbi:redoxin domain-containing protein [Bacillus carboniphilus]|uniref:Redoxin domain-containing protein n=1 Tax=Bacillus carboniphilus TaxID=86663 RepID=A0ABP3G254_9BACI